MSLRAADATAQTRTREQDEELFAIGELQLAPRKLVATSSEASCDGYSKENGKERPKFLLAAVRY